MKTYKEKLLDPRWQKKRLEILQRDNFTCQVCGDKESTLHIHHKRYTKGEPWEANEADLITLCADCHKEEPERRRDATEWVIEKLKGLTSREIRDLDYFLSCTPALPPSRAYNILAFVGIIKELLIELERWQLKCEEAVQCLPLKIDIKDFKYRGSRNEQTNK